MTPKIHCSLFFVYNVYIYDIIIFIIFCLIKDNYFINGFLLVHDFFIHKNIYVCAILFFLYFYKCYILISTLYYLLLLLLLYYHIQSTKFIFLHIIIVWFHSWHIATVVKIRSVVTRRKLRIISTHRSFRSFLF